MGTKTVYKALIEVDGKLESAIAGHRMFAHLETLIYVEGQITYAPKDTQGIFVFDDIGGARDLLAANSGYTSRGIKKVYEATPLGTAMFETDTSSWNLRYPAILLGKEVWCEKPKDVPKKDVWEDVTEECELTLRPCGINDGYAVAVKHEGKLILSLGVEPNEEAYVWGGSYAVAYDNASCQGSFQILKRVTQ